MPNGLPPIEERIFPKPVLDYLTKVQTGIETQKLGLGRGRKAAIPATIRPTHAAITGAKLGALPEPVQVRQPIKQQPTKVTKQPTAIGGQPTKVMPVGGQPTGNIPYEGAKTVAPGNEVTTENVIAQATGATPGIQPIQQVGAAQRGMLGEALLTNRAQTPEQLAALLQARQVDTPEAFRARGGFAGASPEEQFQAYLQQRQYQQQAAPQPIARQAAPRDIGGLLDYLLGQYTGLVGQIPQALQQRQQRQAAKTESALEKQFLDMGYTKAQTQRLLQQIEESPLRQQKEAAQTRLAEMQAKKAETQPQIALTRLLSDLEQQQYERQLAAQPKLQRLTPETTLSAYQQLAQPGQTLEDFTKSFVPQYQALEEQLAIPAGYRKYGTDAQGRRIGVKAGVDPNNPQPGDFIYY